MTISQDTGPENRGEYHSAPAPRTARQPVSPLHDVLDSFIKDGMEFDVMDGQTQHNNVLAKTHGIPGGNQGATFHHASSGDLAKLLAFDGSSFDLELPLPVDMFEGDDGNELLSIDFASLHSHGHTASKGAGAQHINVNPMPQNAGVNGPHGTASAPSAAEFSNVAEAARSVLASLDGGALPLGHAGGTSPAATVATSQQQAQQQHAMQQQPQVSASSLQYSINPQHPGGFTSAPMYVDAFTGQFLHLAPIAQWPAAAAGTVSQQAFSHANSATAMAQGHPQNVQFIMSQQPQHLIGLGAGGLQFIPGMGPFMADMGNQRPASPRKSPAKRRRPSRANNETMSQRTARAEQGFTFDPVTGRMYRHGPALLATARDNREVPVVKTLFNAFHQHSQFVSSPPPEYAAQQAAALHATHSAGLPTRPLPGAGRGASRPESSIGQPAAGVNISQTQPVTRPQQTLEAVVDGRAGSPAPSTSSSHLLVPEPTMPSGRHLNAQIGHGFITSLVTKELQSSTPPPPLLGGSDAAGDAEAKNGDGEQMLGVARDKWSLFWDAYVDIPHHNAMPGAEGQQSHEAEPASDDVDAQQQHKSPILAAVKREAIFLGKFPTRDQAGRAHDIAALKLHGDAAVTNFPREGYLNTLPVLAAHSEEEVVAALKKDSELALQRTSKYKGVRRTAPGQYEARAEVAVVNAGMEDAIVMGMSSEAAAAFVAVSGGALTGPTLLG